MAYSVLTNLITGEDIMELAMPARRRAGLAIENTHKAYSKPGGIKDLESKLEGAHKTCSSHIFNLAQFATEESDDMAGAAAYFGVLCDFAETQYKTKHKVENLREALPVWATYKSNILRAMKSGLDPNHYGSEYDLRKAHQELKEPQERTPRVPQGPLAPEPQTERRSPPEKPQPMVVDRVEEWVGTTTIRPTMQVLISRLIVEAEYVRKGKEGEAERILREAVEALAKLVDKRRIRDEATKAALAEINSQQEAA
jgi:hypothetical protein